LHSAVTTENFPADHSYHPQLADVIALARAVPQATIVMCHVGGVLGYGAYAGKKDEVHAAWRASMAELATCLNVSVKLGGMLNRGAALNFRELAVRQAELIWPASSKQIEAIGGGIHQPNRNPIPQLF
jgi:predicted TIM-barrel fold metal-dependent hydrolase